VSDFFQELIDKRQKLIDALDANKGEINLDIFEDFYPDQAHFVYELLQNAEDAGATEVTFALTRDAFLCEHDGRRTFTEADVTSITGIHNSTKIKSPDKIGKFGVGFKSVFVYTQSPSVRSGKFSFRIVKLILPKPIPPDPMLGTRTRFEFPFDHPLKSPKDAYAEIAMGLNDLAETTLLFLSNLRTIKWQIGTVDSGEVIRKKHSKWHFEVLKRTGGKSISRSHFLKFDQPVPELKKQRVAVAFPLDFLTGVRRFLPLKRLARQLKIVPATPGRVAVFFTAAKEVSGLRFHLHGPFVPELSRASIKETSANEPLFEQLARLTAASLHRIRGLELLTPEFLGVLPNPQDEIPMRYQRIRDAVIEEMQGYALTPIHNRRHAPAKCLVQAKASLKDLLSESDLAFLVEHDEVSPLWAISTNQKNSRVDQFLTGLAIRNWDVEQFVELICRKGSGVTQYFGFGSHKVSAPDKTFMDWLSRKPAEWYQKLYSMLHTELGRGYGINRLKRVEIVRLQDGTLSTSAKCFFPNNGNTHDDLPRVDVAVFTFGKSKAQQENAKQFLFDLGVREVGEAEEAETILERRYTQEAKPPDEKTYLSDLERFISLVEKHPERTTLFPKYFVFQGEDERWHTPGEIFLDRPYLDTDLSAYHGALAEQRTHVALHAHYENCGIAIRRLSKFARAVGAKVKLDIKRTYCSRNPQWDYLRSVGGDRCTSPIDEDYYVYKLKELLNSPSIELSRLVWRTLCSLPESPDYLRATYQRNRTWGARTTDSILVHELRIVAWVPQREGTFVRPADASKEFLPKGFPFDSGWGWLNALQFGWEVAKKSDRVRRRDALAKELGFRDADGLERAQRFAALPTTEQEEILAEVERWRLAEMPDREPSNPHRRSQNVLAQAIGAPMRETALRSRSVSIGWQKVKEEAGQYLRQYYTNADHEMTCQICKRPLPFKLDGVGFFEAVEFLHDLTGRYYQNYLALCPNHSAMYRLANGSSDSMRQLFDELSGNELEVVLAQRRMTIYFSKVHISDLRSVLGAEKSIERADL
jgi:hypothetical protein